MIQPIFEDFVQAPRTSADSYSIGLIRIFRKKELSPGDVFKELCKDLEIDYSRVEQFNHKFFMVTPADKGYIYEYYFNSQNYDKLAYFLKGLGLSYFSCNTHYTITPRTAYPVQIGIFSFSKGTTLIDCTKENKDINEFFPLEKIHCLNVELQEKDFVTRKFSYKYKVKIYSSIQESFKERTNNCFLIATCGNVIGTISFFEIRLRGYDLIIGRHKNKAYLFIHKDAVILSDKKTLEPQTIDVINVLNNKLKRHITLYIIDTYGETPVIWEHMYSSSANEWKERTCWVFYRDIEKVGFKCPSINDRGLFCELRYNNQYQSSFVMNVGIEDKMPPYHYGNKLVLPKEAQHLGEVISLIRNTQLKTKENLQEYFNLLSNPRPVRTDLKDYMRIDQWFRKQMATKDKQKIDMIKDIIRRKENLKKEQSKLELYINSCDYNKCEPVPMVEYDKKVLKENTSLIGIDYEAEQIDTVGNIKLNQPIKVYKSIVKLNVGTKKDPSLRKIELKKLYDSKSNILKLNYKEMKGK